MIINQDPIKSLLQHFNREKTNGLTWFKRHQCACSDPQYNAGINSQHSIPYEHYKQWKQMAFLTFFTFQTAWKMSAEKLAARWKLWSLLWTGAQALQVRERREGSCWPWNVEPEDNYIVNTSQAFIFLILNTDFNCYIDNLLSSVSACSKLNSAYLIKSLLRQWMVLPH